MYKSKVTITNDTGLHARPASIFVQHSKNFSSNILIGREGEDLVDAKSIISLLSASFCKGEELIIEAEGNDEKEAVKELIELINSFTE